MAIPAYRSSTSGGDSSGTSLTVTAPTGLTDNDIIRVTIYIETASAVSATGWTEITNAGGTNAGTPTMVQRVFWKRASGEGASWSFTWGGASVWRGYCCSCYSGAQTSGDPNEAATYNESEAGTSTITGTSITTLGANRKVIFSGTFGYLSATSFGTPNQGTRRVNVGALVFQADQDVASAGATGSYTIQANNTESGRWTAETSAIIEDSGGGGGAFWGRLLALETNRLVRV